MIISDKDRLTSALMKYISNLTTEMFGKPISMAMSTVVKAGVNNLLSKSKYEVIFLMFFDDRGNFLEPDSFWEAFEEIVKTTKPVIFNIRFTEKDVLELHELFKKGEL